MYDKRKIGIKFKIIESPVTKIGHLKVQKMIFFQKRKRKTIYFRMHIYIYIEELIIKVSFLK